ncbi:MAG: hypothetical protein OEW06_06095 [Gemmatimonadota bacterium]|nr:hypothetical protein [Gemmatimonadota bacterium]
MATIRPTMPWPILCRDLLLAALPAIAACSGLHDEMTQYAALGPRYEARTWLATNANPYPLASNRFESATAGAAFVDSLYALGADTVYVMNVQEDSAWVAREGGPYADALLIRLPDTPESRQSLFARGAREARAEGFEPEADHDQRYLYLWWD